MLDDGLPRRSEVIMPATHFITAPTFHRKRVFQNELFGEALTVALMHWRQQNALLLHDYVIMPDHVHLLITAPDNLDVSAAVHELLHGFAEDLSRQYGYGGRVWEPQFRDREVHNAEECAECVRMIHSNPVRVGFCDQPGEYRMSSRSSRWMLDPTPEFLRRAPRQSA
jgi:putative transposase